MEQFKVEMARRKDFAFFWRPYDGETLQDVFLRLRDFLDTIHRDANIEKKHVVVVCHGETMWAWRVILEYWMPWDLRYGMNAHNLQTKIHNCRIIQYSRNASGQLADHFTQVRFVSPKDPMDPAKNRDWQPIVRPVWNDTKLLAHVEQFPRFIGVKQVT